MTDDPILVAITGASGSRYGLRLVEALAGPCCSRRVGLIVSPSGRQVLEHEAGPPADPDARFPLGFFSPEARDRITAENAESVGERLLTEVERELAAELKAVDAGTD